MRKRSEGEREREPEAVGDGTCSKSSNNNNTSNNSNNVTTATLPATTYCTSSFDLRAGKTSQDAFFLVFLFVVSSWLFFFLAFFLFSAVTLALATLSI